MPNTKLYILGMPITICTTVIGASYKMTYRNITTATNAILGRVSGCQHHHINARYGKQRYNNTSKPLDFNQWFLKGIRFYESKGYEFEFINEGNVKMVRICKDGKAKLRTLADFEREYKDYEDTFFL
ncbi:hypothetical protein [Methanosarcina mazei]|jgi:hypothetical protein|nr:hypothetical protein [Methanosarcina mazei]